MSKAKALTEYIKKLQGQQQVEGVAIVHKDGIPIKSSYDKKTSVEIGSLVTKLAGKTNQALQDLDRDDALVSIWIKSGVKEMMIFCEDEYLLTVEKKVDDEKFEHPDCVYCKQNRDGTFRKC